MLNQVLTFLKITNSFYYMKVIYRLVVFQAQYKNTKMKMIKSSTWTNHQNQQIDI